MNHLKRDDILAVCDLSPKEVEVPEWGGAVWIRQLSASERVNVEELLFSDGADKLAPLEAIILFLCRTLVSPENELLFSDEDVPELAKKDFDVLLRVHGIAIEHNGMGKKAAEDLEKN